MPLITLTFPNAATFEGEDVTDVELRSPQLGDSAIISNTAKRNRAMDGTQQITKRLLNQTLRLSFVKVQRHDRIRLENLLKANRGEDITMTGFGTGTLTIKVLENYSSTDDSRGNWKIFPTPAIDDPKCRVDDAGSFSLNVELIS